MTKLLQALAIVLLWSTSAYAAKPNVVLFIADDVGYHDFGAFGGPSTPAIDSIAADGVKFTSFYAAPFCTPTRADVQTGQYHQRYGLNFAIGWSSTVGLPASATTIAEALKPQGYTTGLVGKWHLGNQPKHNPTRHGYDFFFGMMGGQSDYFSHENAGGQVDWWRGTTRLLGDREYSTWAFIREAVEFVQRPPDPFFLVVSWQAAHSPYQGPDDDDGQNHGRAGYLRAIAEMDAGVDQILDVLPANTYVFFMSDNGGVANTAHNSPLRGHKGQVWEGGIRVPAMAKGPGVVHAVKPGVLAAIDLMPTILTLTGTPFDPSAFDGLDFSSVLRGTGTAPVRRLYFTATTGPSGTVSGSSRESA